MKGSFSNNQRNNNWSKVLLHSSNGTHCIYLFLVLVPPTMVDLPDIMVVLPETIPSLSKFHQKSSKINKIVFISGPTCLDLYQIWQDFSKIWLDFPLHGWILPHGLLFIFIYLPNGSGTTRSPGLVNRPCVAWAVLYTALLLINWLSDWLMICENIFTARQRPNGQKWYFQS